jgi:crossover junction endodeoxyribonuclease RuvC
VLLPGSARLSGDAADALAVAICHAHHHATRVRLDQALAPARAVLGAAG